MTQVTIDQAIQIALKHQHARRLPEAEAIYRQILAHDPKHAQATHYLGLIARQMGRNDVAVDLIRRAISLGASDPEAHNNLGTALADLGKHDEAIEAYRRSIALRPGYASAYSNLGSTLREKGRHVEAIAAYRQAITSRPSMAELHYNLGVASCDAGEVEEAIAACRQAIALNPGLAEAYCVLGNALKGRGDRDEAIAAYRQAIQLKPDYAEVYSNLGIALKDQLELKEAIVAYRRAIQLKPDYPESHSNLALALLTQGHWREGWEEYEWRWKCREFPMPARNFSQPQWHGEELGGRTILLHAEQGLGDTIQMIRYVPFVAARGGRVVLECRSELLGLLKELSGVSQAITVGNELPPFDVHCPLMSLPLAFDTRFESIPHSIPYLAVDPKRIAYWRDLLAGSQERLDVGLAWAGRKAHVNDKNRSISLSRLAPLAAATGIGFHSLQVGVPAWQALSSDPGLNVIDYSDKLTDCAETAALIANLDLVITVDTAVAHLAGAMGKPVWVLLPFVPDWRWMMDREDSPWYPTMRLFRQRIAGQWDEVIERVTKSLARQTGAEG
jgi:tetratricopeptide (TPR) repeat protein